MSSSAPAQPHPELPRRALAVWIAVYLVAVVLVVPLPVLTLSLAFRYGGLSEFWMLVREGGGGAYLCIFAYVLTTLAVGALGSFFIAGKRIARWLLFVVALSGLLAGLVGGATGLRQTVQALEDPSSLSSSQIKRIFAEGSAGAFGNVAFGAAITTWFMILVGLAALFRLLSIDRRAADSERARPAGLAMVLAGSVAALGLIASFGVRADLKSSQGALGLFVVTTTAIGAIFGARRSSLAKVVDSATGAAWAGEIVSSLLLLCIAMTTAAIVNAKSISVLAMRQALGGISGERVAPSLRGEVLADALQVLREGRLIGIVDAIAVFAVLLVPVIFAAVGNRVLSLRPSWAIWAAVLVCPLAGSLAFERTFAGDLASILRPKSFEDAGGLTLPTANDPLETWGEMDTHLVLFVTRDGRLLLNRSDHRKPPVTATEEAIKEAFAPPPDDSKEIKDLVYWDALVVVDAGASYATLLRAMKPVFEQTDRQRGHFRGYQLALAPSTQRRSAIQWPPALAQFQRDEYVATGLAFGNHDNEDFTVVLGASSARVVTDDESEQSIPTGDGPSDEEQRRRVFKALTSDHAVRAVTVLPREEDDVATIVRILNSVHAAGDADDEHRDAREPIGLVLNPARETITHTASGEIIRQRPPR